MIGVGCPSRIVVALLASALLEHVAVSQPAAEPIVRGLYNWVHTTFDAERTFAFYRDALGIELAPSPFVGGAGGRPEGIRSAADARSDELVWSLTNTRGARFRTVFMRAANTPFGLELSEFFDIEKRGRIANAWDPGSSRLIFTVRDLDAVVAKVRSLGAAIVTVGGAPVQTRRGRAIVVRDPDSYHLELRQASAAAIAAAGAGEIIETSIGVTVSTLATAAAFYDGLLGLPLSERDLGDASELALYGLAGGSLASATVTIPGAGAVVRFSEFRVPPGAAPPSAFRWRIQDLGAPQFQLQVAGLDRLLERTAAAGYEFVSVGGRPIERPFGRFVFLLDGDGVLVEYVEPTAAR